MRVPEHLHVHQQIAFVYGNRIERWRAYGDFLLAGVSAGQSLVAVADSAVNERIGRLFEFAGVPSIPDVFEGIPASSWLHDGTLRLDAALTALERTVRRLRKDETVPVRLLMDMEPFLRTEITSEQLTALHSSLTDFASSHAVIVMQSYDAAGIPHEFSATSFSPYATFLLSESVGHSAFPESSRFEEEASTLDLAMEQIVLKGHRNLRNLIESRGNGQFEGLAPKFFRHYPDAILMLDVSLAVVYASPRFEKLVGIPHGALPGRKIGEFLPAESVRVFRTRVSLLVMQAIEPNRSGRGSDIQEIRFEMPWYPVNRASDRRPLNVPVRQCTVSALAGNGVIFGYLCVVSDASSVSIPITIGDPTERAVSGTEEDGERRGRSSSLTRREYEIISLIVTGMPNKVIAQRLEVAEVTVKKHLTSIYRKLNVRNRMDLMRMARWS